MLYMVRFVLYAAFGVVLCVCYGLMFVYGLTVCCMVFTVLSVVRCVSRVVPCGMCCLVRVCGVRYTLFV